MRQGTGLLPVSLRDSILSARAWVALAAAAGTGVCAYAGLYPRFDDGALRAVLALTCAPFAAAVVVYALSTRTAARAFGATLVVAAVLGVAATLVPAAILTKDQPANFPAAALFGLFFGSATGVLYGIPLGILAALAHRHVREQTHVGTDRASRIAAVWLFVIAAIGMWGTIELDGNRYDGAIEGMVPASTLPAFVGGAGTVLAAVVVLVATLRLRMRAGWVSRIRAGLEPRYRVRPMELRDGIDALPRLGSGVTVVEIVNEAGSAYRASAAGTAVAIVDDDICTSSIFTEAPAATSTSATSG